MRSEREKTNGLGDARECRLDGSKDRKKTGRENWKFRIE